MVRKPSNANPLGCSAAAPLPFPLLPLPSLRVAAISQSLPPALDAERHVYTSQQAGRVSYYHAAPNDGDSIPLVLIHSINAAPSAMEVKPLFEHYRAIRPVYALELPGFGGADRSDRVYDIDLYVNAITDFLRDVVGQPADALALSLGSEFIAYAALQQPQQFRSLVMISPTGFNARPVNVPTDTMYRIVNFPVWGQALYNLLVTRPSIRLFLRQSFANEMPDEVVEYAHATAHQPGAKNAPFYFVSGKLFTPDIRTAVYEKLTRPVLVIYDQDPNVSFDRLPDTLAANPNWQSVQITPTMGLPHWDDLPKTTAALDAFWSSLT